jgi:hypothetical protein
MKTFRQNLHIWLEEQKDLSQNGEIKEVFDNIQKYIKSKEKDEEHMVNASYQKGYYDGEMKRGFKPEHYKQTYKIHELFKNILKKQ